MFRFKLAEFFSGPGGMGYGAGLSKVKGSLIEHAWASDYDQDSCNTCLLYTSPSPRDMRRSRMPSSA